MDDARREAEHFVNNEKAFHLGVLPTEQSHPKTRGLAEVIAKDTRAGIRMLQTVDEDVTTTARRVFATEEFRRLVESLTAAIKRGGRICFSGCGATGRLSILLEAACRASQGGDTALSIMTGGDYALVRSVEFFEDYMTFGRQQALEAGLGRGDVLVAITEGGETSSVIGTAWQALEAGAEVFFACNNPMEVLAAHVERSRRVIEEPRIVKLDLSSGPMAVAGSTRMQATTSELLVIGAALEMALEGGKRSEDYAAWFESLLRDLAQPSAVEAMARWVEMEESVYRGKNAMTYFGNEFLLDIFTDTTERAPTFSLPPFRKCDDTTSPRPMGFAKNPLHSTAETWRRMLGREPRCLTWDAALYQKMGAAERIWRNPPVLNRTELFKFLVGNEDDPSRYAGAGDCAALVLAGAECVTSGPGTILGDAFAAAATKFSTRAVLSVGPTAPTGDVCHVGCELPPSPIKLWDHLAIKLVLNTISTATAARLGRVVSNWMSYVETSNKKLIDRGTRLVAELAGLEYSEACYELHRSRAQLAQTPVVAGERLSPVAVTLERLRKQE
ncbi:MAG: sugar phosphate isomerase [Verrucomicrobia bacterium]|nr:sugar phosphate isomerase [Verrucomicrobiota bacterium]